MKWLLHRILKSFGLVTIKQARHINQETSALLNRSIAKRAMDDFGVRPNPNGETANRQWADECFDDMMNHRHPDGNLVGAWEL